MSRDLNGTTDFERRLQALLEESVQRVSGRARSRLTQARHAALAESAHGSRWQAPLRALVWTRPRLLWMPAAGAMAAAVLVAFVLWPHAPQGYPAIEANPTNVEDLDLVADREGMDLMQTGDGQFYEWAMAQADAGDQPAGTGPAGQVKAHGDQNAGAGTNQNSG
ncbi:MAG TPA: hypothetical protein VHY36_12565 [Steroidobacteraceae bacterium]|jgi:hypothetical protein|nr:hypothetical protein [Steroidobacteraceae bacterium]